MVYTRLLIEKWYVIPKEISCLYIRKSVYTDNNVIINLIINLIMSYS